MEIKNLEKKKFWTPIRVMVVTYWLGWGFAAMDRLLIAHLFPFIAEEYHLDFTKMGMIMTCMSLGFIVMNFVAGDFSDKYGRKKIIFPSILIFSIGSSLTGFVTNFAQIIGVRTVIGAAEGAYITAAITHVSEESPPEQRGANVGFLQMGMPLFAMFICPLYATQVATHLGWHWAFYLTIIPGLLLAWFCKTRIKESTHFAGAAREKKVEFTWGQVLKEKNVILLTLLCMCWMVWLWAWLSFGAIYFTSIKGYSPVFTGIMLTSLGVGGTLGSVIIPAISDYWGRKPVLICSICVSLVCSTIVLFLPNTASIIIYILLAIAAMGVFGTAPIFMGVMTSESVPFEGSGKAYGVVTGTGEAIGAMVAPTVLGMIADSYGLQTSMWISSCALGGVIFFSLFLRETAPRIVAKRALKECAVTSQVA